jgi:hypothetical protein
MTRSPPRSRTLVEDPLGEGLLRRHRPRRSLPQRSDLHNLPIGEIVFHLTGETRESLLSNLPDQPTLREFDVHDLHVVPTAAQINADAICTSDDDFQGPIGVIEIYRPSQLAHEFGLLG